MYQDDQGVEQDHQAAMDWYLKAANEGDPNGQRKVGLLYANGFGIAQDYSTAMDWFIKAAHQKYSGAQHDIDVIYEKDYGVPQDHVQTNGLVSHGRQPKIRIRTV